MNISLRISRAFIVSSAFLSISLLLPDFGFAASIVWSKTEQVSVCPDSVDVNNPVADQWSTRSLWRSRISSFSHSGSADCTGNGMRLDNPNISITYAVRVTDDATGAVIQDGGSVACGTPVRFEFIAPKSSDIYWFGTGASFDSPYGDWIDGAAFPDGSLINEKNYFATDPEPASKFKLYAALSVAPPTKRIDGLSGFSCTDIGMGGKRCVLSSSASANFIFDNTIGHFYLAKFRARDNLTRIFPQPAVFLNGGKEYTLSVPTQNILHTINVTGAGTAGAGTCGDPTSPPSTHDSDGTGGTVVGMPNNHPPIAPSLTQTSASCVVGTAMTIQMMSTDPDNDDIRYGIDWNNSGVVDQYLPAYGYVPSGTSISASRIFAVTGSKMVRVVAMDRNGAVSQSSVFQFNCIPNQGGDGVIDSDNGAGGNGAGNPVMGKLNVVPPLVRPGSTSNVSWSSIGATACTVTAPNGDYWSGVFGIYRSRPINAETTYTLSCATPHGPITDTATVRLAPLFQER